MTETKSKQAKELSWEAPEFVHYPKSLTWFVVLFVIGVALIIFFVFKKDFVTALLFLLLLMLAYFFSGQKPKTIKIKLNFRGVELNDMKIPFDQIKSFWVVYDPPEIKTLNFETTAYINRYFTIQINDQNPVELREFLLEHLPEELDRKEQLGDKVSRKLGF